jgi:hypothetical protein
LTLEGVEKRQLMAADLGINGPLDTQSDVAEVSKPEAIRIEVNRGRVSNGFGAEQLPAVAQDVEVLDSLFAQFQANQEADDFDPTGQGNDIKDDYREYIQSVLAEALREIQEKLDAKMPEIFAPAATSLEGDVDGDGDGVPDGAYGPRR